MDRLRVLHAMSNGVGFTCAHCEKFWWGVDRGMSECKAAAEGKFCAGPLMGHAFPEYEGPLKGSTAMYCFVCGDTSSKVAIASKGASKGKSVGVCDKHFSMLSDTGIEGERPRFLTKDKIETRS